MSTTPSDLIALLRALPVEIAALPGDPASLQAYADRVKTVPGVRSAELGIGTPPRLFIALAQPIDAAELARIFTWSRPYAVSGDVRQFTFRVMLHQRDLADPHSPRIATEFPRFGAYRVEAELTQRPTGELPRLQSGASPAYDLAAHSATVTRLGFTLDSR